MEERKDESRRHNKLLKCTQLNQILKTFDQILLHVGVCPRINKLAKARICTSRRVRSV